MQGSVSQTVSSEFFRKGPSKALRGSWAEKEQRRDMISSPSAWATVTLSIAIQWSSIDSSSAALLNSALRWDHQVSVTISRCEWLQSGNHPKARCCTKTKTQACTHRRGERQRARDDGKTTGNGRWSQRGHRPRRFRVLPNKDSSSVPVLQVGLHNNVSE